MNLAEVERILKFYSEAEVAFQKLADRGVGSVVSLSIFQNRFCKIQNLPS